MAVRGSICFSALLLWAWSAGAGVLVLESPQIRLEVDPERFSVRFLGWPGGPNFVEPLHLARARQGASMANAPGGISSDVLYLPAERSLLCGGPARVLEHRRDYLLLMGPVSRQNALQVKKEYRIHGEEARLTYKLSVLSSRKEERTVTVRVTAQVPWGGEVRVAGPGSGSARLIRGAYPGFEALRAPGDEGYVVPLGRRRGRELAVVRVPADEMVAARPSGSWRRRCAIAGAGSEAGADTSLLLLLDDRSFTCRTAFEGRQGGVNVGAPLVYTEEWTLTRATAAAENRASVEAEGGV